MVCKEKKNVWGWVYVSLELSTPDSPGPLQPMIQNGVKVFLSLKRVENERNVFFGDRVLDWIWNLDPFLKPGTLMVIRWLVEEKTPSLSISFYKNSLNPLCHHSQQIPCREERIVELCEIALLPVARFPLAGIDFWRILLLLHRQTIDPPEWYGTLVWCCGLGWNHGILQLDIETLSSSWTECMHM